MYNLPIGCGMEGAFSLSNLSGTSTMDESTWPAAAKFVKILYIESPKDFCAITT